ncbi:MAG: ABC transporter ATP-binding protein, partial [Ilumatobacteraceae bacterium]
AHESFDGVLVVKAFGAEGRETERLAEISRRLRRARKQAVNLRSTFESLIDATPSLVNIAIIAFGALRIRSGDMSIGDLSSFVYLFTLVTLPLRIVSYLFSELPHSLSGWDRVQEVLTEPVIASPREQIRNIETVGERNPLVEMEHVYAVHGSTDALIDISLCIKRGSTVAVVGSTSSCKTTLLHVISRLLPVRSGSLSVGTKKVGLVFQEAFLFAESLRYNLTLGSEVTSDDIRRALDIASASEFVDEMGMGLDTELGERGVSLSGGQRQRLALARALAMRSELLLLDDTTSALDPATEQRVLTNLSSMHDEMTTIVVASRPSTIALADEVVFMEGGRIVAQGVHELLLETNHGYRSLIAAFEHDRSGSAP